MDTWKIKEKERSIENTMKLFCSPSFALHKTEGIERNCATSLSILRIFMALKQKCTYSAAYRLAFDLIQRPVAKRVLTGILLSHSSNKQKSYISDGICSIYVYANYIIQRAFWAQPIL
jgi:hypothetical protein